MIVVQTKSGEQRKFTTGRKYNFKSFGRWVYIYDYSNRIIAVYKASEIIGFWET